MIFYDETKIFWYLLTILITNGLPFVSNAILITYRLPFVSNAIAMQGS